jgi:hypothetical protein
LLKQIQSYQSCHLLPSSCWLSYITSGVLQATMCLGLQGVTRMAYSPRLWLMAIGWWNKINQCRKLKLNLTQTWGVCMSLDSGMYWSQNYVLECLAQHKREWWLLQHVSMPDNSYAVKEMPSKTKHQQGCKCKVFVHRKKCSGEVNRGRW